MKSETDCLARIAPSLVNLLAGYLPPGEFDFLTEEEALKEAVEVEEHLDKVITEGYELLSLTTLPWKELQYASMHVFEDESEARLWLSWLINLLEAS